MNIVSANEFQKRWQLFLKGKYPLFSCKHTINYFGIKEEKYYPKSKYVKELQEEFLDLCEREDLWVDYREVYGSVVKVMKSKGDNYGK
jgi:histone deacetylase complex regulatory component SIN3